MRCKIKCIWEERSLKMTQPVHIQHFADEFEIEEGHQSITMSLPISILMRSETMCKLMSERQTKNYSGKGNINYDK